MILTVMDCQIWDMSGFPKPIASFYFADFLDDAEAGGVRPRVSAGGSLSAIARGSLAVGFPAPRYRVFTLIA
jgi:hypothetical protein